MPPAGSKTWLEQFHDLLRPIPGLEPGWSHMGAFQVVRTMYHFTRRLLLSNKPAQQMVDHSTSRKIGWDTPSSAAMARET